MRSIAVEWAFHLGQLLLDLVKVMPIVYTGRSYFLSQVVIWQGKDSVYCSHQIHRPVEQDKAAMHETPEQTIIGMGHSDLLYLACEFSKGEPI
jgi:hypothetical protein